MKVKFGKNSRYLFAIFLALLIAMQLEINRMVLLIAICTVLFLLSHSVRLRGKNSVLDRMMRLCRYEVIILVMFVVIQVCIIGLGFREIAIDIEILSCVYIGIICGAISMKYYRSFETFLKAILLFVIVFSMYYLFEIMIHGLPEGRNSAIGNVSSNYCSAILYLNYPIIFYYLFGRGEWIKNNKEIVKMCYIAIVLSLIVIVLSGSRTAIGAVALMTAQMVLYKQKRLKNKIRIVVALVAAVVCVLVAYSVNPSVRELMDRALEAFGGKNTLDSNVRQLIWAAGLQQFHRGNVFLGLGTNMVTQFERPAHNLFYEVLMCSGYIGCLLFAILIGTLLFIIIKKQKYSQRFFSVMILISFAITALVQPFFSTGYTCGMMIWLSLFTLTADAERRTF